MIAGSDAPLATKNDAFHDRKIGRCPSLVAELAWVAPPQTYRKPPTAPSRIINDSLFQGNSRKVCQLTVWEAVAGREIRRIDNWEICIPLLGVLGTLCCFVN